MNFTPGSSLGSYKIERELGQGGMATVYLAHDLKLDRPVALKVLRPELAVVLGGERFLREIRITAKLQHPHILPLLDSGGTEGTEGTEGTGRFLYYVMPYVEGESLRARLEREKQLPLDDALALTRQIASALDYAHQQGVIHRDIKPENVLLHRGEAVVADFGIALAVRAAGGERLTETGLSLGTPQYMSPEQASGSREADARSDVYSLAAVLYEMLVGEPPHTGPTTEAVLAKLLTQAPVPPRVLRGAIPEPVSQAVLRALAKQPVDRFATAGDFVAALTADGGRLTAEKSIVVLPFANLSPDPENEYFADGLTEEIITDLSQIRSVRVISRSSAMQLKHTTKSTSVIGRELGVRYVLEGTVRRAGPRLRITAQLIDAESDAHLWADKYTGTVDDVFDVQESVSRSIVGALQVTLSPEESLRVEERTAGGSLAAYESYLLGLHHLNQLSREHLDSAVQHFTRAVEIQPEFARAYAGLADTYVLLTQGAGVPPLEAFPKARSATERALELDPSLAEAHASLGGIRLFFDWDWAGAESSLRRALELNPSCGKAHHWLAFACLARGRHAEALEAMRRALALDPLSPYANINMGWILYTARDFDGAIRHMSKALQALPESAGVVFTLGVALLGKGRLSEAVARLEQSRESSGGAFTLTFPYLGFAYARAGRPEDARGVIREMERLAERRFVSPDYFAMVHIGLGEHDRALDYLERACERRTDWPVWFPADPLVDPLRTHPRFVELLSRVGVSARQLAAAYEPPRVAAPAVERETKSIIVVPFENLSPDPDEAFFADGLTDELISDLSTVRALRVISRASAMSFQGSKKTVTEIAREVDVRYVLEGSVRRAGDSLRLSAQLSDAEAGAHLWSGKYAGTLDDVFSIQGEVVQSVAQALDVGLAGGEPRMAALPVADARAYECCLRARQELNRPSAEASERALALLGQGLALVGDNPLLLAMKGYAHVLRLRFFLTQDESADEVAAESCCSRLLELAPESGYAAFLEAMISYVVRARMREAIRGFELALERVPSLGEAMFWLAACYMYVGRPADSLRWGERLVAVDPLTPFNRIFPSAWSDAFEGNHPSALDVSARIYDVDGENPHTVWSHGLFLALAGRRDELREATRHMVRLAPDYVYTRQLQALAAGMDGEGERARGLVSPELVSAARRDPHVSLHLAESYAAMGELDAAFEALENATRRGFVNYPFLAEHDTLLEPLRSDPRFERLMERVKPEWEAFQE